MKEVKLLTEWAESIVEAPAKPQRMGTPMTAKADRPLPRNIDIQYKAQRAHPELSPEQALALYMSDELVDKEKMDLSQNKLINRVKSENDKLTRTVDELGKELHDFEQQSLQTDKEVERLKTLSAKLRPAGELTKQVAQATSQQIEKMMKDVEDLRLKPGMTPDKQKELEQKINDIKSGGLTSDEVKNINNTIEVLSMKQEIDDQMFDKVMNKLNTAQAQLKKKEERFQSSTANNIAIQNQWKSDFKSLNKQIDNIQKRADELDKLTNQKIQQVDQVLTQKADEIMSKLQQADIDADEKLSRIIQLIKPTGSSNVVPISKKATKYVDTRDQDEVQQSMGIDRRVPGEEFTDQEPEPASREKIGNLIKQYKRPERNMKKVGNMNEQIEMLEPSDDKQARLEMLTALARMYDRMFPGEVGVHGEGKLIEIMNRTIDGGLLIFADEETGEVPDEYIDKYFQKIRGWFRRLPKQSEIPMAPQQAKPQPKPQPKPDQDYRPDYEWPPRGNEMSESLVKKFEKDLTRLTGGY